MNGKSGLVLTLILLLAFALRLVNLEGRSLWYDEAFAVLYAERGFGAMIYGTVTRVQGAAADVHPLLYYFLLHLWMKLGGESPLVVRFPSVLFGVGSVLLAFRLARALFGVRTGLLAAFLTAIAPFHVAYSQEARMYSLLCFLCLGAACFFLRGWRENRASDWAWFALTCALALYSHNLAFLFILALDASVLLWRRWRLIRPLLLSHLGTALLFSPWLLFVPGQWGKIRQAYWIPRPGAAELVRTLIAFTFNLPLPEGALPWALFFSLLLMALALFSLARSSPRSSLAFVLVLAFVPVAAMFIVSQWTAVYIERGVLASAVAYWLFLAASLPRLRWPWRAWAFLLLPIALLLGLSLTHHYRYSLFPRPPFPEVTAYLREHYREGDVIIHSNKLTFFPCHYYDRALPQAFLPDPPGSGSDTLALPTQEALGLFPTDLEKATAHRRRVWLVIFQRAVEEYRQMGYPEHPHKAWLQARYHLLERKSFNDLDVYLFVAR